MANLEDLQQRVSRVAGLETQAEHARKFAGASYAKLVAEIAEEVTSDAAVGRLIASGADRGLIASVKDEIGLRIDLAYGRSIGDVYPSDGSKVVAA